MFKSRRIGELLLREKKISSRQLEEALEEQKRQGGTPKFGAVLVQKGFIDEETLTLFLAKHFGLPQIDLRGIEFDPSLGEIIPAAIARKYEILPIGRGRGQNQDRHFRPLQHLLRLGRTQVLDGQQLSNSSWPPNIN